MFTIVFSNNQRQLNINLMKRKNYLCHNFGRKFILTKTTHLQYLRHLYFLIMLLGFVNISYAQKIITGTVKQINGNAVEGATISIIGTNISAASNKSGNFSIGPIENGNFLKISAMGFQTYEIEFIEGVNLNIILNESSQNLDEVVVVGYGTQRRSNITGAIASADLEVVKNSPNTNIIQSLQGNLPGLNVGPVTSSGSTPSISVRGQNTISGNQNVLIILDGIQYNNSLSSINPDDIASIDLLKDASSTAVYGAQAANGVLLITSRKGKAGEKPRINISSSYAGQNPSGNIRPLNKQEYLDKIRDLHWDLAYLSPEYTISNPEFNLADYAHISVKKDSELVETDFNWWTEGTNLGYINDNQLSISGASEKVNYLISGAFTNQKGYIINDLFKRKTIRANIESNVFNWMKVGIQSFGSFVNSDGAEPTVYSLFQMSPMLSPYLDSGELNPFPFNSVDPSPFLTYDVDDKERHNYYFANIYADANFPFLKGLNYRLNFGNNGRNDQRYYASKYGGGMTGEAYKTNGNYYDYTLDNILTYSKKIINHELTATLVYGAVKRQYEETNARGTGFTRMILGYNNLSEAAIQKTSSTAYSETLNYQMARLNYAFQDRYILTSTIRRDGFSGFAANNKWGVFPSMAIAWILSDEYFMKMVPQINHLKLRAGYGVSGNQTSRYSSLDIVNTQPAYVFGDGGNTVFGQNIASLANPDLRWERTKEFNIGLDFTFLKNRISGTFDFYNRNTQDLLFSVQIPTITGFSSIFTNVGEVKNRGFELAINSKNYEKNEISWNTTFNFSKNRSKIVELLGSGDLVASNLFIGERFGSIYGYQTNGIYQIDDEIPEGYFPGTYRVVDRNNDGIVNANDRYLLGSTEPAFRISLLNSFRFKNFTLTFLLNSIQGGKNGYLGSNSPSIGRTDVSIRNGDIHGVDYWTPKNPSGKHALWTGAGPTINPTIYHNRSFVRLQDISLSYALSKEILEKIKMQDLNLFISGKNLKTWSNWEGWDPETGAGLTWNGRPLLKGISFGINATF